MEFNENMIGKRVKEIKSGDLGFVLSKWELGENAVWVNWEREGALWIDLDEIVFIDEIVSFEEVTINGKRYKLTPIE